MTTSQDLDVSTPTPPVSTVDTSQSPVDLPDIRRKIVQKVGAQALDVVQNIIDGNIRNPAGIKFLFEMTGLYPAPAQEDPQGDDSLAKTLLSRLGLEELPPADSTAAPAPELPVLASAPHAVE